MTMTTSKAQRDAELLRQTQEVWQAICSAKPGNRLGKAIREQRPFESLSDDDKIWSAKLAMALRPIMAPRVLPRAEDAAGNNPEPQAGELASQPEASSTPANSDSSKSNGAVVEPDGVTDAAGKDVTPGATTTESGVS